MGDETGLIRVEKLTYDNYPHWKFNMKMFLMGKDLWEIVEGTYPLPADASEERREKKKKKENLAMSIICLAVSTPLQIYVRGTKSAKEAWDALMDHFEEKTLSKIVHYRRKLYRMNVDRNTNMTIHVNNLKTIAERLESVGNPVEENDLAMILITSLPDSYNNLVTALETLKPEQLTWCYVRDRVLSEYERRKGELKPWNKSDDAMLIGGSGSGFQKQGKGKPSGNEKSGQQQQQKKQFKCHYCHEKGHFIKDCPRKAAAEENKKQSASFCKTKSEVEEVQESMYEIALFACASDFEDESSVCSSVWFGSPYSDDYEKELDVTSLSASVSEFDESVVENDEEHCVTFNSSDYDNEFESSCDNSDAALMTVLSSVASNSSAEDIRSEVVFPQQDVSMEIIDSTSSTILLTSTDCIDVPTSVLSDAVPLQLETLVFPNPHTDPSHHTCSLYPEEVAMQVGDETDPDGSAWWLDSGASVHMSGEKKDFVTFNENDQPGTVALADKSEIASTGTGDIPATIFNGDNEKVPILFKIVLYVPGLKRRLLSISAFTEMGATIIFQGSLCTIIINDKRYELGHKHGKLWKLNNIATCCAAVSSSKPSAVGPTSLKKNSLTLWHLRYGHLNLKDVHTLYSEKLVDGIEIDSKHVEEVCEGCAVGKAVRYPFPKIGSKKSTDLLNLIHTDVCGPLNIASVGGSIYFVTFIDDFSNYVWVYMLKKKSEVLEKFIEFVAMAENSSGKRLKKLRNDNGGEYVSNALTDYCKEKGILTEPTIPYTPQQNGKAERMNCTIMDNVRASLYHAKLPLYLWAEAVSTIVYLRNRSPTSSFKGATPFEKWHGVKPDVGHLRAFGCNVFMHVPDEKRQKLDKKAVKGIFVGYPEGSKGYKIFIPESKKFSRSRDVKFLENSFNHSDLATDMSENNSPDKLRVVDENFVSQAC